MFQNDNMMSLGAQACFDLSGTEYQPDLEVLVGIWGAHIHPVTFRNLQILALTYSAFGQGAQSDDDEVSIDPEDQFSSSSYDPDDFFAQDLYEQDDQVSSSSYDPDDFFAHCLYGFDPAEQEDQAGSYGFEPDASSPDSQATLEYDVSDTEENRRAYAQSNASTPAPGESD
jgi:hypothetical protein